MTRKYFSRMALVLLLISCTGTKQFVHSNPETAVAELTFDFTRQTGMSSNQFAVWVEEASGQPVRTIYATRFTANGGWKRRPSSIPTWVKQFDIAHKTEAEIDAVTGATPKTGTLRYLWDGTDRKGNTVLPGAYVFILEGTLRSENRVIYKAPILLGKNAASAQVSVEYFGDSLKERIMIDNLAVWVLGENE